MNLAESDVETQVLKLAELDFSTRKIAEIIGTVSQSTVSRILQKANTGPQAVLREKARSWRNRITMDLVRTASLGLLAVSVTVLAAAMATIAW